jgi:AcrR family transcriptional regulator
MLTVSIFQDIDGVNMALEKKMIATQSATNRPYHHGDLRRALIDAAVALVTEKQDWTFSLREVARHAGVSHNAPYNHFGDKQDLLIAVAEAGFERLRERMAASVGGDAAADKALLDCGRAYLENALENPALYRLMFGPALAKSKGSRPQAARHAGNDARAVLVDIIVRGARSGVFAIAADDPLGIEKAAFFSWSLVHGLAMALLDGFLQAELTIDDIVEEIAKVLLKGLLPRQTRLKRSTAKLKLTRRIK